MEKKFSYSVRRHSTAAPWVLFDIETDGSRWSQWAGPIIRSSRWISLGPSDDGGVGAIRAVGAGSIATRERTVVYQRPDRHDYVIEGNRPCKNYRAVVEFHSDGNGGTNLIWSGSFEESVPFTGPLVLAVFRSVISSVSQRLVQHAEEKVKNRA